MGLFKYFSDVEFSGEENAYYSKFTFREGVINFLLKIWEETAFMEATKRARELGDDSIFTNFLGHVLTDLNFCVEETFEDLPKYKELL